MSNSKEKIIKIFTEIENKDINHEKYVNELIDILRKDSNQLNNLFYLIDKFLIYSKKNNSVNNILNFMKLLVENTNNDCEFIIIPLIDVFLIEFIY